MLSLGSRILQTLCVVSLFLVLFAVPAWAQETAAAVDTWKCLPSETAFAVRIPNGAAFVKELVENTKLGSVVFSEQRKQLVTQAIAQADDEDWKEMKTQLNEYGLEIDDLPKFLSGESGYAIVLDKGDDGKLVPLGVAWLEPGEDLVGRAKQIITMAIEDQEDSDQSVIRIDVELAEHKVMQLMIPDVDREYTEEFEYPEGYENMSDAERDAAWEEAYKKWEDSAEVNVSYGTVLCAAIGDRLLLAHSFRTGEDRNEHPDGERLAGVFAQLLEASSTGEGGFVEKYSQDELVSEVMSVDGVPCLEMVGDSASLIQLGMQAANSRETAGQINRVLGLDAMGMFALKSALNDDIWESRLSLAIGQPREGLMRLLEQESIDLAPPEWIPASAIRYGQLSFDLGQAYEIIKEVVTKEFPDQAGMFAMADMQANGFAQASVFDILKSLGKRHVVAYFEPDLSNADSAGTQGLETGAIVWQVTDEQIWSRILKAIAPLATSGQTAELSNEQGYSGFRVQNETMELGAFLGNGNLVLGVGSGVVETTLSSLNNPPQGKDSFRGSAVYERANDLLDLSDSVGCNVIDGARYAVSIRKALLAMLDQLESTMGMLDRSDENGDVVNQQTKFIEFAKLLMPTEDEMENILGVGVSRSDWNDDGVHLTSMQELPPPDEK